MTVTARPPAFMDSRFRGGVGQVKGPSSLSATLEGACANLAHHQGRALTGKVVIVPQGSTCRLHQGKADGVTQEVVETKHLRSGDLFSEPTPKRK